MQECLSSAHIMCCTLSLNYNKNHPKCVSMLTGLPFAYAVHSLFKLKNHYCLWKQVIFILNMSYPPIKLKQTHKCSSMPCKYTNTLSSICLYMLYTLFKLKKKIFTNVQVCFTSTEISFLPISYLHLLRELVQCSSPFATHRESSPLDTH